MGRSYAAICNRCETHFTINDGGALSFHLRHCDTCGAEQDGARDDVGDHRWSLGRGDLGDEGERLNARPRVDGQAGYDRAGNGDMNIRDYLKQQADKDGISLLSIDRDFGVGPRFAWRVRLAAEPDQHFRKRKADAAAHEESPLIAYWKARRRLRGEE